MAGSLSKLWMRGRAIPWAVVWEVGRPVWFNSRDRMNQNLSLRERQAFARIVRKRRGRPWNLSSREGQRILELTKKAATGERDPGWDEVGISLVTLLPPRVITEIIWDRRLRR